MKADGKKPDRTSRAYLKAIAKVMTKVMTKSERGGSHMKHPVTKLCPKWPKERCFAVENGSCTALNDTTFNKKCPFFKTRVQVKSERTERI